MTQARTFLSFRNLGFDAARGPCRALVLATAIFGAGCAAPSDGEDAVDRAAASTGDRAHDLPPATDPEVSRAALGADETAGAVAEVAEVAGVSNFAHSASHTEVGSVALAQNIVVPSKPDDPNGNWMLVQELASVDRSTIMRNELRWDSSSHGWAYWTRSVYRWGTKQVTSPSRYVLPGDSLWFGMTASDCTGPGPTNCKWVIATRNRSDENRVDQLVIRSAARFDTLTNYYASSAIGSCYQLPRPTVIGFTGTSINFHGLSSSQWQYRRGTRYCGTDIEPEGRFWSRLP